MFTHLLADRPIGDCLAHYGEWAEAEVCLFEKIVRPGQTVVEAGANIGAHTVPLARMVGPTGIVHAFEPSETNYQLLRENVRQNSCENVATYQCALGDREGVVEFPVLPVGEDNNFGGLGLYSAIATVTPCPTRKIDGLRLETLDFLKVDVEGHERAVIAGAFETITRTRPGLFVESLNHHAYALAGDGHVTWLIDLLKPLGYGFWHYITPLFNAGNYNRLGSDRYEGQWSFDLLCLPAERGRMMGLQDAETEPLHCDDPDLWRGARFVPGSGMDLE